MNSQAIQLHETSLTGRASRWADLPEEDARRRAVRAAHERDLEELWSLAEAFLAVHGPAGALVSSHTLRAYKTSLRQYLEYAGAHALNVLRPRRAGGQLWVNSLAQAGKSPATVQVRLAGGRLLYAALRWVNATDADPFADARPPRDPTPPWDKRGPYEEDEVARLLEHAEGDLLALLLLCAHAGLRIGEALQVRWADVDLERRRVRVRAGKGGKTRVVVMSRTLQAALRDLPRAAGTIYIVRAKNTDAARERLERLCRRAGVRPRGFHALRHYAGTRLFRQTGNLDAAARQLGHAQLETTRVYAKWSDDSLDASVGEW